MSDFGEEILYNLGVNSSLNKPDNAMGRLIDNTIGEWLTRKYEEPFFEQFFLQEATGKYLDLHGKDYDVKRRLDESDEDYRKRIIYTVLGQLTVNYLIEVYNVNLYVNVPDFDVTENTLTSDNPYMGGDGFMGIADETTKAILNKKFIMGTKFRWL